MNLWFYFPNSGIKIIYKCNQKHVISCKYTWGSEKRHSIMYWISSIKNMNSPRSFKMQKLIVWPQTWKFWFYGVEVRIYAEPAQCICVLCVILNSLDWIHYEGCQLWMVVLLKLTTTKIPVNITFKIDLAKLCWDLFCFFVCF